jgi:uncharacterized protein
MSDNPVFRPNGVTYLRIPAPDPQRAAAFYHAVFDWNVDNSKKEPSFEDGTGHVIGHFVPDLLVVGEAGVLPYIYVASVGDALSKVTANGGETVTTPYDEGNLLVANFRDPAGNVIGLWQQA